LRARSECDGLEAVCGESVATNQNLDPTQIARIAAGPGGPAMAALKPLPGTIQACVD
jgi:hypothetical protein